MSMVENDTGMKKTALVTGASSGIGYELAKVFAREGHDVVLTARTKESLDKLARELQGSHSVRAISLPADMSDSRAADQIHATLEEERVRIDFLVNNAGFGTHGPFSEAELTSQLRMMQVNMTALVHMTRLFLPDMVKRGEGRVLNVASTAAFAPGPMMAVYYASKAFVLSFSQAVADELKNSGVTVTALCPGPTRTGFQGSAGMEKTRLFSRDVMDANVVAEAGYRGMMKGKPVVVPGLRNSALRIASRLVPTSMAIGQVRRLNEDVQGHSGN